MPTASSFLVFGLAALLLLVIPGPSVLYIVTRSIAQGRSAGIASMLGVHTGTLVHIVFAAAGVSALLVASSAAFTVVKLLGAAYLVGLGVHRLTRRSLDLTDAPALTRTSNRRLYVQGIVVNVLNPKTALFFLAFLPQFVDPDRGPVAGQAVLLGLTFVLLGIVSDGCYALAAGALGERLRRSPRFARRTDRASGLIYIGLGLTAALAHQPNSSTVEAAGRMPARILHG